jgi:hypothetical protein
MENDLAHALARVAWSPDPDPELVAVVADALLSGQDFADILSDLISLNRTPEEAEAAIEAARILTRRERGVVTRGDIVDRLNARYRRSMTGMATFGRSVGGPLAIIAFAVNLRNALGAIRHLGQLSGRSRKR